MPRGARPAISRFGERWFLVLICIGLPGLALGSFDDSTILAPTHGGIATFCHAVAILIALASAVIAIRESKTHVMPARIFAALGFVVIGFVGTFLTSAAVAKIIEQRIDFPPGATRIYARTIPIARAYDDRGTGRNSKIRTERYDATLKITRQDYGFMLAHRRPDDDSSDAGEIASDGYFCARVTIEQAGEALRVLYAGSYALAQGSVIICPREGVTR